MVEIIGTIKISNRECFLEKYSASSLEISKVEYSFRCSAQTRKFNWGKSEEFIISKGVREKSTGGSKKHNEERLHIFESMWHRSAD